MYVCADCGTLFAAAGYCPHDGKALGDTRGDPLLGTQLGPYRVVCQIGAGGMGQVYKGVQPNIGSRVAIKFLSRELSDDPALVERFFAEARAANVIRHESIVNVLDLAVTTDGRPYIVMEYLDGLPLATVLKRSGRLPLGSSVQLIIEVLAALEAAHAQGIVHRDIKPENLFVSPQGRVKLLDFGIAKLRPGLVQVEHGTRAGVLLGTPQYMSPEQALGKEADARADLYAIGLVLYQMVTGTVPFVADTLFALLKHHVETTPPTPRSHRPEIGARLEWVILGALQKDPAQRFQSAAIMADALRQASAELPPSSFIPLLPSLSGQDQRPPLQLVETPPRVPTPQYPSPSAASGVTGASVQPPGMAPATSRNATLVFLGTLAAVVFSGLLWAGWGAIGWLRSKTTATEQPAPSASPPASPTQPIAHGAAQSHVPGFEPLADRQHVPVWEHWLLARERARSSFDDAQLIRMDLTGVHADGSVDLNVQGDFPTSVLFRFRSPRLSHRPTNLPSGATFKGDCQFHYLISEYGKRSSVAEQVDCEEPTVPFPSCQPRDIWARAVLAGAPRGNFIGNVSYFHLAGQGPRWAVSIGDFSRILLDDCPGK